MVVDNFRRTLELLKDDKQKSQFLNIIADTMPKTDLMVNVLEILDEFGPYNHSLTVQNREQLTRLLLNYTDGCWPIYFEGVKIEPLFPYMQTCIYHVQAETGYRVATTSEVENGVIGLIAEVKDNIPEKDQKLLKLLQWSFDGSWRTYRDAGYKVTFNDDRTVATTYMQMLRQAQAELNELIDFMIEGHQFDYDMMVLRKVKRAGKYKYPGFAFDEVKADMQIKQLVFNLKNQLPKGQSNPDIKKAWRLILSCDKKTNSKYNYGRKRTDKDIFNLEPYDVQFLRKLLVDLNERSDKYISVNNNRVENDSVQEGLRNDCEKLIDGRNRHLIRSNHFVFKIIQTLSQNDYKWISSKQRNIIDQALRELDVAIRAKENQEKMKERVENTIRSSGNKSGALDIDNMSSSDLRELENMNNSNGQSNGQAEHKGLKVPYESVEDDVPNIFDVATMLGDGLIGQL